MSAPDEDRRSVLAATLRAVADLIESDPDVPLPKCDFDFYVRGKDESAPAMVAKVTAMFPGPWKPELRRSGDYAWLYLNSGVTKFSPGLHVTVSADAAAVCAESGTKTVTTWKPVPSIADLIEGGAEFDA